MELEQQLRNARQKLANIKVSREIDLQRYKQELAQRETKGERADTLQAFRDFIANYEVTSAQDIEARQAVIAAMEARLQDPEYQAQLRAAAGLEGLKETARRSWIAGGGNPEDFEAAWERLKFSILEKHVLNDLAADITPAAGK